MTQKKQVKTEVEIIVEKYCNEVIKDKKGLHCLYLKKAVKRFNSDVKRIDELSWDYFIDWEYVQKFYDFSKELILPDRTEYLRLLPWQLFCITNLLGWKYKDNKNKRRFRTGVIFVPRKNGKTSGFMFPLLFWDLFTTESSESYLFAKDDTQAGHFLNELKKMTTNNENLSKLFKYNISNIIYKSSKIAAFSSETVGIDGYKPSMAIIDEYWCYKNERCVTSMKFGGRARLNSLVLIITTSGLDVSLPAYTEHEKVKKILNGLLTDDTYFGIIYEADESDDWKQSSSYIKANPSIDTILDRKILEQDLQDALQTISHQSDYKAKTLNWWSNETSNWITLQKWNTKTRNKNISINDFSGQYCYGGIDLSSTNDFTAYTLCFEKEGCYYLFHRFYVPDEKVQEKYRVENINIKDWIDRRIVTAIPGPVVNYDYLIKDIEEDSKRFNLVELCYDRWNANRFIEKLDEIIPNTILIEFDQSLKKMSQPTKEFERLIYEDKIIDASPVMLWMVTNTVVRPDINNNYKPMKQTKSGTQRIDGVVTSIMAVDRCLNSSGVTIENKDFNSILKLF